MLASRPTTELVSYLRTQAEPKTSPFSPMYQVIYSALADRFEHHASFKASKDPKDQEALSATVGSHISTMHEKTINESAYRYSELRPTIDKVLHASAKRSPLEVSLLLMAGVHRSVLMECIGTGTVATATGATAKTDASTDDVDGDSEEITATMKLHALYYPPSEETQTAPVNRQDNQILLETFWDALHENVDGVTEMIKNSTVQTNETARGMFWLFPTLLLVNGTAHDPEAGVHLVDLGSSAGLNLVAEQRRFTFQFGDTTSKQAEGASFSFGGATDSQFIAHAQPFISFPAHAMELDCLKIVSRNGCDLNPIPLYGSTASIRSPKHAAATSITDRGDATECFLKCFIWPDQKERLERLEEGMAAFRKTQETAIQSLRSRVPGSTPNGSTQTSHGFGMPIHVDAASLPHGLPGFLNRLDVEWSTSQAEEAAAGAEDGEHQHRWQQDISEKTAATRPMVVIYNTYMTTYLEDEGLSMENYIGAWARRTGRKVMWVQSEPPRWNMDDDGDDDGDDTNNSNGSDIPHQFVHHWCLWSIHLWDPSVHAIANDSNHPPCSSDSKSTTEGASDDTVGATKTKTNMTEQATTPSSGATKFWKMAWVHPHGRDIHWIPDQVEDFMAYCGVQEVSRGG